MSSEEVIKLIKIWLIDVQEGRLAANAFVQVVDSLLIVYGASK